MPINESSVIHSYFDDASLLDKVPFCFLLLGGTYAALQLIGVLLLQNPPGWNTEENVTAEDEVIQDILTSHCRSRFICEMKLVISGLVDAFGFKLSAYSP